MKRPPTSTSLPFVRIAGFFIPIDAVISDLGCGLHRRRVGKKGWISKWELHNLLFLQRARQPNRYPFSSIYRQSVPSNRNSLTHAEYSATSTDLGTDKYRIDPPPPSVKRALTRRSYESDFLGNDVSFTEKLLRNFDLFFREKSPRSRFTTVTGGIYHPVYF